MSVKIDMEKIEKLEVRGLSENETITICPDAKYSIVLFKKEKGWEKEYVGKTFTLIHAKEEPQL